MSKRKHLYQRYRLIKLPATGVRRNNSLKRGVSEENIGVLLLWWKWSSFGNPSRPFLFRPLSKRQINLQTKWPNNSTIKQFRNPRPDLTQTYRVSYQAGTAVDA
jgi:hypothetical protein